MTGQIHSSWRSHLYPRRQHIHSRLTSEVRRNARPQIPDGTHFSCQRNNVLRITDFRHWVHWLGDIRPFIRHSNKAPVQLSTPVCDVDLYSSIIRCQLVGTRGSLVSQVTQSLGGAGNLCEMPLSQLLQNPWCSKTLIQPSSRPFTIFSPTSFVQKLEIKWNSKSASLSPQCTKSRSPLGSWQVLFRVSLHVDFGRHSRPRKEQVSWFDCLRHHRMISHFSKFSDPEWMCQLSCTVHFHSAMSPLFWANSVSSLWIETKWCRLQTVMRTVHQQNVGHICIFTTWSNDHSMSSRYRIQRHFSIQHLQLRWVVSLLEPFVLSLSLRHVFPSAISPTMSVLPTAETLSLKVFGFAYQSMKIGLMISKCFSCLIVIVVFNEARVHWLDTIWVTLWSLVVVQQWQTNLVDDVPFWKSLYRTMCDIWRSAPRSVGTNRVKPFAMVMSATSQPVSLTCSFHAASHISKLERTSEYHDTQLMSWTRLVSLWLLLALLPLGARRRLTHPPTPQHPTSSDMFFTVWKGFLLLLFLAKTLKNCRFIQFTLAVCPRKCSGVPSSSPPSRTASQREEPRIQWTLSSRKFWLFAASLRTPHIHHKKSEYHCSRSPKQCLNVVIRVFHSEIHLWWQAVRWGPT